MASTDANHRPEPDHVSNGMTNRVPYIIRRTRPHGPVARERGRNFRGAGSDEKVELRTVQEEPSTDKDA